VSVREGHAKKIDPGICALYVVFRVQSIHGHKNLFRGSLACQWQTL
jgi:hypothetical protein